MKKIMYLFTITALTATFVACEKMDTDKPIENTDNIDMGKESVIENFAKAFAVVLYENEECRDLIKTEALKKINHDYDVLYMLVKDKELNNGATFTKLFTTKKDDIQTCNVCEFRYACFDCRVFISEKENLLSKPLKCNYNPYTAKWDNEQ